MSQDNHSKDYLVSIMFSHYDQNNNGNLEVSELNTVSFLLRHEKFIHIKWFQLSVQERLDTFSSGCTLSSMIKYDDSNHDGKLSLNEFYTAFSKLYSKQFLGEAQFFA